MEKSVEELQAQVEAFAGSESFPERKDADRDQTLLLAYAGELAAGKELGPDLARLAEQYKERYVAFLRKRENRELVEQLEESIGRYGGEFSAAVGQLRDEVARAEGPEDVPSFLGRGSTADTFKAEVDGRPYALKLYSLPDEDKKSGVDRAYHIYKDVRDLLYAKGVEHVPQLVTHSLKDQVIVMTLMPGRCVAENAPGGSEKFTDDEVVRLIQTVKDLQERGLAIDYDPQNLLHDDEEGFSILDFYAGDDPRHSLEKQVMRLRNMLVGVRYREFSYRNFEDYSAQRSTQNRERIRESLDWGLRILRITKEHFPDIFRTFQGVEPSELLRLGETGYSREFSEDRPYDRHVLGRAVAFLES